MQEKTIQWGMIGCGSVTELKSGPAFNKVNNSKLVAVMRRDAAKAQDYAQRHGVPQWYDDAQTLINDENVTAVYVATPPSTHAEYAIAAMRAGKPVYVEKPMAATYVECQEMLRVSEETGMPLFVAYYRRSLPGFLKVKDLVESKTIGEPLFVNIRLCRPANEDEKNGTAWRTQASISGGGIFHDLASHQLDYLDYLFGTITEAHGHATNVAGYYDAPDTVVASFKHKNGVVGTGAWSFATSLESRQDNIEIIGTEGRLEFSSFGHTPLLLHKNGHTTEVSFDVPENIQYYLIQQVVDELNSKGACASTGLSAARTSRIMEQIVG